MPGSYAWLEREWVLGEPIEKAPELIERLRGTCWRLRERTEGLTPEQLTFRPREPDGDGGERETWSIQENVGHLLDLLTLEETRLSQYLNAAPVLAAADMSNRKTWEAGHNRARIADLLDAFERQRLAYVARVEGLGPEVLGRTAEHPRLEQPMRFVDLLRFFAEHDDYHVARITAIRRLQRIG